MTGLPPPLPEGDWGDLIDGLPDVGLLDDIQLDAVLGDANLPPGLDLDCLGLDLCDAGLSGAGASVSTASHLAHSDLLDSLQLDGVAFGVPATSSGAGHSPCGSDSDSPAVAPLSCPAAGTAQLPLPPLGSGHSPSESPAHPSRASPATSESEYNGEPHRQGPSPSASHATTLSAPAAQAAGANGLPAAGAAAGSAAAQRAQQQGQAALRQHITEEEKRLARMQRNRENAQLSRQRKKQHVADLEARCAALTQHNTRLVAAVQRLTAENGALRQQLALICQQAGRNAAAAAAATKPGAAAAKPAPAAAPKPTPPARGVKPAAAPMPAAKPAAAPATAAKPAAARAGAALAPAAKPASQPVTPAAAPAPMTSATAAAAAAVAARGLLPQWPLLPLGFLPKVGVPLQQQAARAAAAQQGAAKPLARPAPAAAPPALAAKQAPQAAAGPAAAAAAGGRAAKRARTAAGASTAFLALFTLFMFAGPFSPAPLTTTNTAGTASNVPSIGAQRALQALPEPSLALAAASSDAGLHRGGRSLQALPAAASGGSAGGAVQQHSQYGPLPKNTPQLGADHAATLTPGGAGGGRHLQQLLNSTLQALLLEPGNAQLEAAALQRLQELGPVALLLDADAPGAPPGANPLAASAAFPRLADQLFGSAGLEVPQVCQKVLEFDAASVPHAARSRRSLERFVLGATGFRGRSLAGAGGAAPALPAAGGTDDDAAQARPRRGASHPGAAAAPTLRISEDGAEDDELLLGGSDGEPLGGGGGGDMLLPPRGAADGPVLVSVLLPANASGGGSRKLAAVDKVFVVLLHPADRYTTYSCALPRPVVL